MVLKLPEQFCKMKTGKVFIQFDNEDSVRDHSEKGFNRMIGAITQSH